MRFGKDEGEEKFSLYLRARQKLIEQVVPNIPAAEPSLTDHTGTHLADVLDNADHLIYGDQASEKEKRKRLNAVELYCLCLGILFHDVGNVYERKEHEKRVADVYDWVRAGETAPQQERLLTVKVAGAHSGKTRSGSRDTLADLFPSHLWKDPVRLPEIGAILRFADEIAEGEQRTSKFMQEMGLYDEESMPYHRYASMTTIMPDRGNGRIALTYSIRFDPDRAKLEGAVAEVRELLQFAYSRIVKLNQERQYARHYSTLLDCFKSTHVTFNFWAGNQELNLDLPELVLSDKIVPGERQDLVAAVEPAYAIDGLCARIRDAVAQLGGKDDKAN